MGAELSAPLSFLPVVFRAVIFGHIGLIIILSVPHVFVRSDAVVCGMIVSYAVYISQTVTVLPGFAAHV